jgi:hypothetical protein
MKRRIFRAVLLGLLVLVGCCAGRGFVHPVQLGQDFDDGGTSSTPEGGDQVFWPVEKPRK